MATTRRTALGILGASSIAAAGALTPPASASAHSPRVPKGLRPGGELDEFIAAQAARDVFSGSVIVTHRGRTVFARSDGWSDKARGILNGPGTLFGMASIGKVFTSVAVAQLAQRGLLRYSDTVGAHLSGYAPEVADHVTVHHLLTNTAGLRDYFQAPGFAEEAPTWTSFEQVTEGIGRYVRAERLAFPPGSGDNYSNSGYHVLTEIVEAVSGRPYHEHVRESVFTAAGMESTDHYTLPEWRTDRRIALPYWRPPGSAERVDSLDEQSFAPGVFSTCAEMARFARALWTQKLLNPAYTRLLLSPKLPLTPLPPMPGIPEQPLTLGGYALSNILSGDHWSYGSNGGASIGASTALEFFPELDYVLVVLSNYEIESIRGIPSLARGLILGG